MSGLADDVRGITSNSANQPGNADDVISRVAELEEIVRELASIDLASPRFSSPATRVAVQNLAARAKALLK
ncbi:MAG: hypothetical protein GXX83_07385 [Gaiellales bacterium]|nr:hypothetical protein [Gaiellales bacterium]